MKRFAIIFVSLLFSSMLFATPKSATQSLKIAVIDMHQILAQSPQVKKIRAKLQEKFKPRAEKLEAAEKHIQAEKEKLQRNSSVMSQAEHDKLVTKINQEQRDLIRKNQDFQDDLNFAQQQAMHDFIQKVQAAVQKVANKEHYDLVLPKYGIPYVNSRIEITKQVIAEINHS